MKKSVLALSLALASTQIFAGGSHNGSFDITNPFNHATRPELAKETKERVEADKHLQSQVDTANKVNDAQDKRLDKTNQRVDAVAYTTNSNTARVGKLEVRADKSEQAIRETNAQLEVTDKRSINNAVRLDDVETNVSSNTATIKNHGGRISTLEDYSRDMDTRLSGRLDSQQSEINSLKRDVKEVKNMAAIALSVAGHQFSTDQSAGFQVALSGATIAGSQAIALGAGGAVSEKLFFNAGVSTSGGVTGGVISGTYRLGN